MKGTFKESEIEIINLSKGHDTNDIEAFKYCGVVVISKDDYDRCRAMETEIKLLRKCLDEATEDRDRYKRQLDELNVKFDEYIRREKQIRNTYAEKICGKCRFYDCKCHCAMSDNFGENTDSDYGCDRYEPDADTEIL